jgi:hypothetical protein
VIGFPNKLLGLAAFLKPGSLVIAIQKPDFVSRSALLASALGMNVHVFVDQDSSIDVDVIAKLIRATSQRWQGRRSSGFGKSVRECSCEIAERCWDQNH